MKALVLTGRVIESVDEQKAWAAVSALFKLDLAEFHQRVLARCPMTIQRGDEERLERLRQHLLREGADVQLVQDRTGTRPPPGPIVVGPAISGAVPYLRGTAQSIGQATGQRVRARHVTVHDDVVATSVAEPGDVSDHRRLSGSTRCKSTISHPW